MIAHNIPKTIFITASGYFLLFISTLVIYFEQVIHLSMTEVFFVQAFFGFSVFLLEVPSGYLADRWSRRGCLIWGTATSTLGMAMYSTVSTLYELLFVEILLAIGISFVSGADSAMIYDSLISVEKIDRYPAIESKLSALNGIGEAIASLVGIVLALASPQFPFLAQAIISCCGCMVAVTLVEPPIHRQAKESKSLREILRFSLLESKTLQRILIGGGIISGAGLTFLWLSQPFYVSVGFSFSSLGYLWAFFNIVISIGAFLFHRAAPHLPLKNLLRIAFSMSGTLFLVVGAGTLWGVHYIPLLLLGSLFWIFRGFYTPAFKVFISTRVTSEMRATVLSIQSMLFRLSFAVGGMLVAYAVDTVGMGWGLVFGGILFTIATQAMLYLLLRALSNEEGEEVLHRSVRD